MEISRFDDVMDNTRQTNLIKYLNPLIYDY